MPNISGALTTSQFPVFTIYVQKNCLRVTPSNEQVESVTDGRGALRISPATSQGARNPLRPAQRPATSRAEPVGAQALCNRAWSFERIQGYELETLAKRRRRVANRQACEELCLGEREFTCRYKKNGDKSPRSSFRPFHFLELIAPARKKEWKKK